MKEIKVLHPFFIPPSKAQVWELLWDVQAVAECIPGCQSVVVKEPDHLYEAKVRHKAGMFLIGMTLDIQVLNRVPLQAIVVEISGRELRLKSEIRQILDIQLSEEGDGTRIEVNATLTIHGMLEKISKYLIEMQIHQVLNSFAENFASKLS